MGGGCRRRSQSMSVTGLVIVRENELDLLLV